MNHLAYGAIHTNSSATRYHKKHSVYDVDPTELHDAYMDLRIIRDSRTGNISLRPRLLIDCSDGIHQVHFDWNSHNGNNSQNFTCSTMLSKPNKVIRCYVEPMVKQNDMKNWQKLVFKRTRIKFRNRMLHLHQNCLFSKDEPYGQTDLNRFVLEYCAPQTDETKKTISPLYYKHPDEFYNVVSIIRMEKDMDKFGNPYRKLKGE